MNGFSYYRARHIKGLPKSYRVLFKPIPSDTIRTLGPGYIPDYFNDELDSIGATKEERDELSAFIRLMSSSELAPYVWGMMLWALDRIIFEEDEGNKTVDFLAWKNSAVYLTPIAFPDQILEFGARAGRVAGIRDTQGEPHAGPKDIELAVLLHDAVAQSIDLFRRGYWLLGEYGEEGLALFARKCPGIFGRLCFLHGVFSARALEQTKKTKKAGRKSILEDSALVAFILAVDADHTLSEKLKKEKIYNWNAEHRRSVEMRSVERQMYKVRKMANPETLSHPPAKIKKRPT